MSDIKCPKCGGETSSYLDAIDEHAEGAVGRWHVCFECEIEGRDIVDDETIWNALVLHEKGWCNKNRSDGTIFLIDPPWQGRIQDLYREYVDKLARQEIVQDE